MDARTEPTPVLLLHGAGVAGWMWDPVRAHLAGLDVRAVDLPGHGRASTEPFRGAAATVDVLAADLARPAIVVGFSWGAQLAVELTARHPQRVAATIVISALARPVIAAPLLDPLVRATLPLARSARFARVQGRSLGVPEELMDAYVATSQGGDPTALAAIIAANNRFTVPPGWGHGETPAVVVWGEREGSVVRSSARSLARARPGTRTAVVAGAAHDAPFRAPEWLAAQIQSLASA